MLERFLSRSYMPHGHCYFWETDLVWMHVLSDLGVFLAYSAIPAFLVILLRRRGDIRFRGVVWLFVAFIMLCGFTHLMGAITVWHPLYRVESLLKMATALVSIATALTLFRTMPLALAVPTPSDLRAEVEQRRQTEGKLREELRRNEAILAALPDAILELDSEGALVSTSGATRSRVAEQEISEDSFEEWEHRVLEKLEPTIAAATEGEAVPARFRLLSPLGVELDYLARVVRAEGGGWVVSVQDVSDQTRLVESLRLSREILEQFVYTASHDLRSPLRAVTQLSTWLEEDLGPKLEGENLEHLRTLRQRVRRMDAMLTGLLEFSRAGRVSEQVEPVDLGQVLAEVVEHEVSEQSTGRPMAGFTIRGEAELPTLNTVRAPLERVIANLVINAVKHHDRDEGEILLRVDEAHPHHFVIEVEDDGPGIPERHQKRIFQLFQTLVPKDRKEGTGMGLAIARRTLTSLGGGLEVVSPARGERGTIFRVYWPRTVRESVAPEVAG